jgi:hypothetical protein
VVVSKLFRLVLMAALAGSLVVGCSDDGDDGRPSDGSAHDDAVADLTGLLPADARGVFAFDLASLTADDPAEEVEALLAGEADDVVLAEAFAAFGSLTASLDVAGTMSSAVLVQTTDAAEGSVLLADVGDATIDEVVEGARPDEAGTSGPEDRTAYDDGAGNTLVLLPDGVLVAGGASAVESVVEIADGSERADPADASEIRPFLPALDTEADLTFAYGLPALFEEVAPDRTLRGAAVVSGALEVADGSIGGSLAFHTSNAAEFVESYNRLNRNATGGDDPSEEPLELGEPIVEGLGQVQASLPASPIDGSPEAAQASRNVAKKLLVGMEAHEYAEEVVEGGNPALVDLLVKSEADGGTPPSPGSVFIRWEFRDEAARKAFEENELPPGFTLAPTQFFESDDPEGGYFLALNLYNSGGGTIVNGMRAEWDVFVDPPEGADPDAGERPRFMIVDALGEAVSADPLNLVTPAEPLSHAFEGDAVVSTVERTEGDRKVPVFRSSFPKPDPATAPVARFTREMAIGNDYIYWPNGVYDRVVYNASTFNHDAYLVDPAQVTVADDTRWAQYLKPEVKDVVYYVNTLEYVASPMANLDSDHLDVTPEWLEELSTFKYNGHQRAFMRGAVDQLFLGKGDVLVGETVGNETPSADYHFEITDPEGFAATLDLPDGHRLATTSPLESGEEAAYLTLSVSEVDGALEGTEAAWTITVDDEGGRPSKVVLYRMTADVGVDPVDILKLPTEVRHGVDDGQVRTQLSSPTVTFDASFATEGAVDEALSLDWIEAGDEVCSTNGICDQYFYDAETLDVPVHRSAEVAVRSIDTPWDEFIADEPAIVTARDNAQEYAVKRWHDLAVEVDELPVEGLDGATHTISGTGSLVGRTSDVVDSTYTYTGDAIVDGDELTFAIDQEVQNALGESHIYTTGTFDLTTGQGSQTVVDCRGPDLMCSDIVGGSTAIYTAGDLDASDRDAITWQVEVVVELGGSFGTTDSASTFSATAD